MNKFTKAVTICSKRPAAAAAAAEVASAVANLQAVSDIQVVVAFPIAHREMAVPKRVVASFEVVVVVPN